MLTLYFFGSAFMAIVSKVASEAMRVQKRLAWLFGRDDYMQTVIGLEVDMESGTTANRAGCTF